jgi:hypothetical protein
MVRLRRDQGIEHAPIRVIPLIHDHGIGHDGRQQMIRSLVDCGMDLGAQAAFAAADCLVLPFEAHRRCADGRAQSCCQSLRIHCRHRWPGE